MQIYKSSLKGERFVKIFFVCFLSRKLHLADKLIQLTKFTFIMTNISNDPEGSCNIADAMNTYNWALCIIKSKGYKLFLYPDEREAFYGDYWALKGQRRFIASDPLRLLGIISLWENLGDNWQTQNILSYEKIYDELGSLAYADTIADFEAMTEERFQSVVADYRIFFESLDLADLLPAEVSRAAFFEILNTYYYDDFIEEYHAKRAKDKE